MSDVDVSEPSADAPEPTDEAVAPRRAVAPFVVLGVALVFAALFVVLVVSKGSKDESVSSYLINRPAPRALGTTLDGKPFDLSTRKGSWVVINFFDPTCVPCVQEHPQLIDFAQQQASLAGGAELYTVVNQAAGGTIDDVRRFFQDNGGTWPVIADPTGAISVAFGVAQVPETWVIDPNGIVRLRYPGTITAQGLSIDIERMREAG